MTDPERRKRPRIEKQYYAQVSFESAKDWLVVTLQNLSAGGMAFFSTDDLPAGTIIKARINFPPADDQVRIMGQVIRSVKKNTVYVVAVAFHEISKKDFDLINQFAAKWLDGKF